MVRRRTPLRLAVAALLCVAAATALHQPPPSLPPLTNWGSVTPGTAASPWGDGAARALPPTPSAAAAPAGDGGALDPRRAFPRSYANCMWQNHVTYKQRTQFLVDWVHALKVLGGPRELCAAAQDDCAHGPRMPQPSPFARTLVDRAFVMRTTDERAFEVLRRYTLAEYGRERLPELLTSIDAVRARRALDGWLATGDGGAAAAAATMPPLAPATPPSAADLVTRQTSMVLCHNLEVPLKHADWARREWSFHLACDSAGPKSVTPPPS